MAKKDLQQFKLTENCWFAWQMIPGYVGERSVPYCSPIYVTKVKPRKTGQGIINLEFINVFYAAGVQGFEQDMKILKRAENYLIGDLKYSPDTDSGRSAVISHIEFEWLRRFCPELWFNRPPSSCSAMAQGSVRVYLDEVFFNNNPPK